MFRPYNAYYENKPTRDGIALLKARKAERAIVSFSGGNDEGSVHSIVLQFHDGTEEKLHDRESGYYDVIKRQWVDQEMTPEQRADSELYKALEAPVDAEFGSFAGEFYVSGTVTWDVSAGVYTLDSEYDYSDHYNDE